jgi:hypothetical protein
MVNFNLDWNDMKKWPPILWVIFSVFITFVGIIVSYCYMLYSEVGVIYNYVLLAALIALFIRYQGWYMGPGANLHLHHYMVGIIGSLLLSYQNVFITVLNALFSGVMIEGGCKWGYSGCWSDGSWTRSSKTL